MAVLHKQKAKAKIQYKTAVKTSASKPLGVVKVRT